MFRTVLFLLLIAVPVVAQEGELPWAADLEAGVKARDAGEYRAAVQHFEKALALQVKALGERDPAVGATEHEIGYARSGLGEYVLAIEHFRRAHSIIVDESGATSFAAAYELWFIADSHQRLGQFAEAEKLARQVFPVFEAARGPSAGSVGELLAIIAAGSRAAGRYADARRFFLRAYEIRCETYGRASRPALDALWGVGGAEYELGRYASAITRAAAVLEVLSRVKPPDPDRVASCLSLRGICLAKMGLREEALPDYRRALKIRIELHGEEHPWTANAENNMGGILRDLDRLEEAEKHYRRSIEIHRAQENGAGPDVAFPLNGLAIVRRKQKRLEDAERLCLEALAIRGKHGQLRDSHAGGNLLTLAQILRDAERYEEAEALCARAFEIFSTTIETSNHGFDDLSACWLAVLSAQKKTEAMAEVDRRITVLREAEWKAARLVAGAAEMKGDHEGAGDKWHWALVVAGQDERRRRTALAGLGRTLFAAGMPREAIPRCEEAAALFRKTPDEDVFARLRNLLRLIDALDGVGRRSETVEPIREALPLLGKAGDRRSVRAIESFIHALATEGALAEALPLARQLPEGNRVRVAVLILARRIDEAETSCRLAMKKDPSAGSPWLGLARIRQAQGRLVEAEACARKCIALDGETTVSLVALAAIVKALGREEEAREIRDRAAGRK